MYIKTYRNLFFCSHQLHDNIIIVSLVTNWLPLSLVIIANNSEFLCSIRNITESFKIGIKISILKLDEIASIFHLRVKLKLN